MPELHFKGKEFVFNHPLTVPFRPLIAQPDKSILPHLQGEGRGGDGVNDNLIIHGDNLHALKALLPHYAGKVDCIFIDPPYNTGNENWCYNDNVNNPIMKEWLSLNPVNKEDMLRHDKWACMMYPRLKLLHELLSERGSIWMTLDDNEIHHARMILDEIFGDANFVASVIWQKNYAPKSTARHFSEDHDYVLVYARNAQEWTPGLLPRTEEQDAHYSNPDNDPRGVWRADGMSARNYYSKGMYPVTAPSGRIIAGPPSGRYWVYSEEKFKELDADNRIWWGADGNNNPAVKRFISEVKQGRVPQTLWFYDAVGHTQDAKKELISILNFETSEDVFITPKPTKLIERVLQLATDSDSVILDSFAGSGTTAHAVLSHNAKDNGNRRFILVECEEYADTLTAERVRRVINGYDYQGMQKEELMREKMSFATLKQSQKLLREVEAIEEMKKDRFDKISKTIKNDELLVVGEKRITERMEGLGGGFTYYTLGEPLDLDKLLTGENLPDFGNMGAWLFHTATGDPLLAGEMCREPSEAYTDDIRQWYLGQSRSYYVWLIYKPDLEFLKSRDASLTLSLAEKIAATGRDKKHLVFAPARFVANKLLLPLGVEHAPLPFALYRFEKG